MRGIRYRLLPILALALALPAAAQETGPDRPRQRGANSGQAGPDGTVSREAMWPAPMAEDWKRPCLVKWERSFEDAVAVSKATGRPILVCVNMDGEIASEHYAGIRYREPETARLYEPYVTVIASVYRHNPRDYDDEGNRVLCPRFGSVTCGEHIAIEPGLFEKYFDGRRVAPRHIGLELDGEESYDVFYAWDTASVFETIREGAAEYPATPPASDLDRPLDERLTSRANRDRSAVERAFRAGDREVRRRLLQSAAAQGSAVSVDLLRLALQSDDELLKRSARQALAKSNSFKAVNLIDEALADFMPAEERDALIETLVRLGENSPRARLLAVVHKGVAGDSGAVDLEAWSHALDEAVAPEPAVGWYELEARLEGRAELAGERPDSAGARLGFAEASLALAVNPQTAWMLADAPGMASKYSRLLFHDAYRAALEAEELGAEGWRVQATAALAAHYLGEEEEAHRRAEAAVEQLPPGEEGWNAAAVLALFAQARQQAIQSAVRAKEPWPPEWLADVHEVYTVLARHPLADASQPAAHYDFLVELGARGEAARVLDEGLARFADSPELHERLRRRGLERGPKGLEAVYEEMLRAPGASPHLDWFAGYASLIAAELHRRSNDPEAARASYGRSIAHFQDGIERSPETRETADHYVALAHAGLARMAFERGEDPVALDELLACFEVCPEAADSRDGLNISPVDTAKMLRERLRAERRAEPAARLEAALKALHPGQLELPDFEREIPADSD